VGMTGIFAVQEDDDPKKDVVMPEDGNFQVTKTILI
jgi:hypothetical protein